MDSSLDTVISKKVRISIKTQVEAEVVRFLLINGYLPRRF